jgi:hypothetical protein
MTKATEAALPAKWRLAGAIDRPAVDKPLASAMPNLECRKKWRECAGTTAQRRATKRYGSRPATRTCASLAGKRCPKDYLKSSISAVE